MKKLLLRTFIFLMILVNLVLIGALIWRIIAIYPWGERQRINELTEKYGDELLEAVKRKENALINETDIEKLDQYATDFELRSLQHILEDKSNYNTRRVGVSFNKDSLEVISYTPTTAELVVIVTWELATYEPNSEKIINSKTWTDWAQYWLQLEDGIWKVSYSGACGGPCREWVLVD